MSIKKQFPSSKKCCKVTFRVAKSATKKAKTIALVGDFNNWSKVAHPMKKQKNGDFALTIELPLEKEFQYRYLYDNATWENDWDAEYYVATEFPGTENSAVRTFSEE